MKSQQAMAEILSSYKGRVLTPEDADKPKPIKEKVGYRYLMRDLDDDSLTEHRLVSNSPGDVRFVIYNDGRPDGGYVRNEQGRNTAVNLFGLVSISPHDCSFVPGECRMSMSTGSRTIERKVVTGYKDGVWSSITYTANGDKGWNKTSEGKTVYDKQGFALFSDDKSVLLHLVMVRVP